jgi:hypothetical protein
MSRRDEWNQVKESMFGQAEQPKSVEEREKIPDVACGVCRNFSENAYVSDGRGTCKVLKTGSDISMSPPVYVLEGEAGFVSFFNTNSSKCSHFIKQELIDKDGHECDDPAYRRAQRQMEKV